MHDFFSSISIMGKSKRESAVVESKRPAKKAKTDDEATPSPTLYVKNLNDQCTKSDLKRYLYMRFSSYGHILDIVAMKTMRGQAFVVFNDIGASSSALNGLQKSEFMGKQLEIEFAKSKSHAIAKLDGSFVIPEPPKLEKSVLPLAPFEDVTAE
ncbi:U2 small nuclear ribonucleoprotein B'' [Yarrowia sp. B02]|nr:U2 small nuclear ribonucleoprotein B'' [Yarrowia sp. B02]